MKQDKNQVILYLKLVKRPKVKRMTGKTSNKMCKNTSYIDKKDRIFCNGFDDVLGHPGVYLAISSDKDYVDCPYCDCRFIYNEDND